MAKAKSKTMCDLQEISNKITRILNSCVTPEHLNTARNYIDQAVQFIKANEMLYDDSMDILFANFRGRLLMKQHEIYQKLKLPMA